MPQNQRIALGAAIAGAKKSEEVFSTHRAQALATKQLPNIRRVIGQALQQLRMRRIQNCALHPAAKLKIALRGQEAAAGLLLIDDSLIDFSHRGHSLLDRRGQIGKLIARTKTNHGALQNR